MTRRAAIVAGAALVLLLAWEASGLDLVLARLAGGAAGFPGRGAWVLRTLLHDGGRLLAGLLLAAWVVDVLRPHRSGPTRRERAYWLAVALLSMVSVTLLKRTSATSCPWDLAEFGGRAQHVSHWAWGVADGGPGHCFPSGHAVAAFGFFAAAFLWRRHRPARARALLAATLVAGALFGTAQVLRGAHYASHVLWSAWICWGWCVLAAWAEDRRSTRSPRAFSAA